jgi:hypothetical protein
VKEIVISALALDEVTVVDGMNFENLVSSSEAGRVLGSADIDGDSTSEIIVHNKAAGKVRVLRAATLEEISSIEIGSAAVTSSGVFNRFAIGDVTGDGRLELIVAGESGMYVLGFE